MAAWENGKADDPALEALAWLFVKTDEEILEEAEVAFLNSMFHAQDPRTESRNQ